MLEQSLKTPYMSTGESDNENPRYNGGCGSGFWVCSYDTTHRKDRRFWPPQAYPLAANGTLKALARQHSRDQAARGTIGHDGFRQRSAQAKAAGLSGVCTENVGVRYRSAQALFSGWRNSAGHNTNMLRPNMRYAGVSVYGADSTFFACG